MSSQAQQLQWVVPEQRDQVLKALRNQKKEELKRKQKTSIKKKTTRKKRGKGPRPCAADDCDRIVTRRNYCYKCQKRKERGKLKTKPKANIDNNNPKSKYFYNFVINAKQMVKDVANQGNEKIGQNKSNLFTPESFSELSKSQQQQQQQQQSNNNGSSLSFDKLFSNMGINANFDNSNNFENSNSNSNKRNNDNEQSIDEFDNLLSDCGINTESEFLNLLNIKEQNSDTNYNENNDKYNNEYYDSYQLDDNNINQQEHKIFDNSSVLDPMIHHDHNNIHQKTQNIQTTPFQIQQQFLQTQNQPMIMNDSYRSSNLVPKFEELSYQEKKIEQLTEIHRQHIKQLERMRLQIQQQKELQIQQQEQHIIQQHKQLLDQSKFEQLKIPSNFRTNSSVSYSDYDTFDNL